MPRNTRNFWIELEVDGRATKVACGPVRKDGGFYMTVKMRDCGEITKPLIVEGRADGDELTLLIDGKGQPLNVIKTTR